MVFSTNTLRNIKSESYDALKAILLEKIDNLSEEQSEFIDILKIKQYLQDIINEALEINRGQLIKSLFNSDSVQIGKVSLTLPDDFEGVIEISMEDDRVQLTYKERNAFFSRSFLEQENKEQMKNALMTVYTSYLIKQLLQTEDEPYKSVYLPAARTGFMLTKGIINSYARKKTFDLAIDSAEQETIQPFSRSIIEFLNVVNDMSEEQEGNEKYKRLVAFIQNKMVQGNVEIGALGGKELSYIPKGQQQKYPFRTTSAVVTELSPLLLLLEHKEELPGLFYEEPEMCLHPALQKKMGQLLIKMVNAGIDVTATTHSDIILQHINNMIRLQEQDMSELSYDDSDRISKDKVRVYQFTNLSDGTTDVTELKCGDNGFVVPTFNDALDEIMDETIMIQK